MKSLKNMFEFARQSKILVSGISLLVISAVIGWGVFASQPNSAEATNNDCSDAAIIKCGVNTAEEFASKYAANKTGDLTAIYQEFGLSSSEINKFKNNVKPGKVYKDGRVVVDGEVVATNALVLSREKTEGAIKKVIDGKTYYLHEPTQDPYEAMVMFNDKGVVEFILLKPCANAVSFTPETPEEPEVSIAECVMLIAKLKESTRNTYEFDTEISTEGNVKVIDYTFDFGDGSEPKTVDTPKTTYTYPNAGEWQAQVTVKVEIDGKVETRTSDNCVAATPVEPEDTPEEECKPGIPVGDERCEEKPEVPQTTEEKPTTLPATGPASIIAGTIGASSLAGAGYYLAASRKKLLDRIFNR